MSVIQEIETHALSTPHASAAPATVVVEPLLLNALERRVEEKFISRRNELWTDKFFVQGLTPGPNAVRLDGNDYLGLSGHEHIIRSQAHALQRNGVSMIQSSVFLSEEHPAHAFEQRIAKFVGKSNAVLCQSGYAANIGLLQAIADQNTPIYMDALAHASLWQGALIAGAPTHMFRHNDAEHLSKQIERHGPGIVVVDSVYSTTGSVCPLEAMVQVTEQHGCMIVVDESHSLGTHGPSGRGLTVALGLQDRVHFITASLAKAFAGRAGFFTVPNRLRHYVLPESFPNVFSSCLLPHEVIGLAATLDVIETADMARTRLFAHTCRLRDGLAQAGYPIGQGTEQIISLEAGPELQTMQLRNCLEERGVFSAMFCAPATSKNRSMMRLTVSAALTDAEVDHVVKVAQDIAPIVQPQQWPIAKRLSNHKNRD
ncbi:MAG: alpha-hydroxyketone-type quorum-sensing autoinducer synthase [Burkholderiaceae bacterium]